MIPSVGRIVHYKMSEYNVTQIEKRRADARASQISGTNSGAQVHVGNGTQAGLVYPLLITRVFDPEPTEESSVNGQVFLDGNDVLWVTSVKQGDGEGQWLQPERV